MRATPLVLAHQEGSHEVLGPHDCIATAERNFLLQAEVIVTRWRCSQHPDSNRGPTDYKSEQLRTGALGCYQLPEQDFRISGLTRVLDFLYESTFLCNFNGGVRRCFRPVRDPGRGSRRHYPETLLVPVAITEVATGYFRPYYGATGIIGRIMGLTAIMAIYGGYGCSRQPSGLWSNLLPCRTTSSDRHRRWRILITRRDR